MGTGLHQLYLESAVDHIPGGTDMPAASWQCPSNIALVKYWGKRPVQLPANPSLSFTLHRSYTRTDLIIGPPGGPDMELDYYFEEKRNRAFEQRIKEYLLQILPYFPFLNGRRISIRSRNTFPHSSGIASSASSMGALALGICSVEQRIQGRSRDPEFYRKASYMARLGSGSASRSVYGGFVTWGRQEGMENTSDEHASPLEGVPGAAFTALHDAILIVSPATKTVSSRAGHALMEDHPYAAARYVQAGENIYRMRRAIEENDVETFVQITENEALTLHGLMMSSDPSFFLLKPGTLEILSRVRHFRRDTDCFMAFTLDAGPNIHLIYHASEREKVLAFIRDELLPFCHREQWIDDRMGNGPEEVPV
jgi:diphosphomevalonate decarboxylase